MGMREMRKHIAWYTTGLPHSAMLRRKINEIEHFSELIQQIRTIFEQNKGE